MKNKELQIEELIVPTVEALGACVWGVEYLNQGKYSLLRIFVEREEGVSVDLCAEVSRHVSDLLDVEEIMPSAYTLEVSSPGLDRRLFSLDQFAAFAGTEVKLKLKRAFEGKRKFRGQLRGVEGDEIIVGNGDDEILFPFEVIEIANVVPEI